MSINILDKIDFYKDGDKINAKNSTRPLRQLIALLENGLLSSNNENNENHTAVNVSKIIGKRLKGMGCNVVDGFLNVKRFSGKTIDYFAKATINHDYEAEANQTEFIINFEGNDIDVFVNGIKKRNIDYDITENKITFKNPLNKGEWVNIRA